jgi:competence protein ComEC
LVLEFPGGSRALVDGGGTWSGSFDMGRAITAPYLTSNRPPVLDYMIMTHPHLDHSRGLMFPLKHFRVERFAHNGRLPDGREMADALAAYGREPEVWRAGQSLEAGKGAVMEVLHPDGDFQASGENDPSLTLRVVWRGRGMALLPGDIEEAGTRALLDSGRDLTARVLILPHHGGSNELTAELLERVRPELAVACAGHLNYRRLPHFEVRAALAEAGIPLLVTGENGMVSVSWNSPDSEPVIYSALDRVP